MQNTIAEVVANLEIVEGVKKPIQSTIIEVAAALKIAEGALRKVDCLGLFFSREDEDAILVHLSNFKTLKQIPGEVKFSKWCEASPYPVKAQVKYLGVNFFCLLKATDVRRLNLDVEGEKIND